MSPCAFKGLQLGILVNIFCAAVLWEWKNPLCLDLLTQ
jgi:hypothetical protein